MKKLTLKFELANEEYAQAKAIFKVYGYGYMTLHLGIEGLIMPLLDALDEGADEETLADARTYDKEYKRIMKQLNK